MINWWERSERVLILELSVIIAIVLIYLLTVIFKPEASFMEISDKITTLLNWLDITLTWLFHRIIPVDLTTLSTLIDNNSNWQWLIGIMMYLKGFTRALFEALLSCTSPRLKISLRANAVLSCKGLVMVVLCHRGILIVLVRVLT